MKTDRLFEEAAFLPIEEKVHLIDSLLKSLNTPQPSVERDWMKVAKRRLTDIQSGAVRTVSGEEVFNKIHKKFTFSSYALK